MARYTRLLTIAVPVGSLYQPLAETFEECNMTVIHRTDEYIIAREKPSGGVPFAQLVTAEVLIDNTRATDRATRLTIVVKNEELPLKANNRCSQMYELISQALEENGNWELLDSVAGLETN
jgi:hypothetical protein